MGRDVQHGLFLSLSEHNDLYNGATRYFQPFDDVDDLRILEEKTQTLPCFLHGSGPAGQRQVDQIGNYIPMQWSDAEGCVGCAEWRQPEQHQVCAFHRGLAFFTGLTGRVHGAADAGAYPVVDW